MNKNLVAILALLAVAGCEQKRFPTQINAQINPNRTWYHTGQMVELNAVVADAAGDPILEGVEAVWTVEPADAVTAMPGATSLTGTYVLNVEGRVEFGVCLVPEDPDIAPYICDTLAVRVDDGAPTLEVTSPMPGAELDDPLGLVVTGNVADRSMVRIYVNGQVTEPDGLGNFEVAVEAFFGVNHLDITATDGLTDAPSVEMDVLWAPAFSPSTATDGTPELVLNDGLEIWLGQDFFDDRVPLDTAAPTPIYTDDLADLLELVISRIDISGLIPDPVVDSPPTFSLRVLGATISQPQVELDLTDDGADLFIRIGRLEATTSGVLVVDTVSLPLSGTISGSAVAYAQLTIRKDSEASPLVVTMSPLTLGIESLDGNFESAETTAVFQLVAGILRTTLEGALTDAVGSALTDSVPMLLADALGAIDTALEDTEILLNAEPFPAVTIQIDGGIDLLRTQYLRDMQATLRTTVGTDTVSVHPETRGVPRLDAFEFTPPFINEGSLQVGVRLAFLNGLLHGLWSSGLLDIDASALLPEAVSGLVSAATIDGRMTPVLRPPFPGEEGDLVLAIGQMELDLTFMGEPVRYAIALEAGVSVNVAANQISIDISETPVLTVWTLQPPSNPRLLTTETIETLLLDLWPSLRMSVTSGLQFELPIPGLGDLGGLAPSLSGLTLALESGEGVRMRNAVLVLDARLQGTLP